MYYELIRKVKAEPMNRLDYNIFRGWTLPENEEGRDEGYIVVDEYSKHTSWLPKYEFERISKAIL